MLCYCSLKFGARVVPDGSCGGHGHVTELEDYATYIVSAVSQVLDAERYGHVLVKAFTQRAAGPGLEAVLVNYRALHDQVQIRRSHKRLTSRGWRVRTCLDRYPIFQELRFYPTCSFGV